MFVLEYLHTKYPKMPTKMLQDAVSTYTKSSTLALMAKEFGVEDVARWIRSKVLYLVYVLECPDHSNDTSGAAVGVVLLIRCSNIVLLHNTT